MLVRERIEAVLGQKGWTGSELARRLGEHRNWVNYRLSGRTVIKADELSVIAAAMEIDPCELIPDESRTVQPEPSRDVSVSIVGERTGRMLEDFLALEMGLAPEHVQAVTTIVHSLARTA